MENKTKDMYEYLAEMQEFLQRGNWTELEKAYEDLGIELTGSSNIIAKIAQVNMTGYEKKISKAFDKALKVAIKNEEALAIYFEYDLNNDFQSCFYICNNYHPLEYEDDDWACEYEVDVKGPSFKTFGELYDPKFDRTNQSMGINLFLIARTIACFGRVVQAKKVNDLKICIAFHDQDPIMRIVE